MGKPMPETVPQSDEEAQLLGLLDLESRRAKLQQYYADARDRANSAEKALSEAIRGAVLINGAALGLTVTVLKPDSGLEPGGLILTAADKFIVGAVAGIVAVASFAAASFCRSYFEFESAEVLYHPSGNPAWRRRQRLRMFWAWAYVAAMVLTLLAGVWSLSAFASGATRAVDGLKMAPPDAPAERQPAAARSP